MSRCSMCGGLVHGRQCEACVRALSGARGLWEALGRMGRPIRALPGPSLEPVPVRSLNVPRCVECAAQQQPCGCGGAP